MTTPQDVWSSPPAGTDGPSAPLQLVRDALRAFTRALKARQLYLPNNPMHLKATDIATAAFSELWKHTEELVLEVRETELRCSGEPVVEEIEKGGDSLSWILFRDGIRELRITRGFEEQEMRVLLDVLQRARRALPDEEDLLALLSNTDFSRFEYRFVGSGAGELDFEPIESGAQPERFEEMGGEGSDDGSASSSTTAGIVRMEDFDPTLYFLDQSEIDYLREAISREFSTDLRSDVIAVLLDTFERQTDTAIRDEIISDLESMLILLLSGSRLRGVAYLLREAVATAERAPDLDAAHREWLEGLSGRLSKEAVLRQLFEAMESMPLEPAPSEVYELFALLPPEALAPIFEHLSRPANPEFRRLLDGAADRLARANTAEVLRLIGSTEHAVALGAIARAGAMKTAAAVPALSHALVNALSQQVRLAALEALAQINSPAALQALEAVLEDSDREVRVAAARAVAFRTHRQALPRIERAIRGRALRESNLTEKLAFFEAYGALAGEAGVDLLDEILNGKARLGRRIDPELRACAAAGLARITSHRSRAALERASGEKEAVIRNAVRRALRGGVQ